MGYQNLLLLFALAGCWGASFLFMRIAAPALGPVLTIELRVLLAALALLLYAAALRQSLRFHQDWKKFLLLGALNAAIPFVLICTAELHLTASLAAILNATTPLFTALVARIRNGERLGGRKSIGLVLGIAGVGVLMGWDAESVSTTLVVSILFSLLAAVFYAAAGVYAARNFQGRKPLDMAIGQQAAASLLLLPFALFTVPSEPPSATVVWSVLALAVVCTSLGYLLYFRLIQAVGAVKTLSVTFLIPIFGILWGALFLREPIQANTLAGLVIILLSVSLVVKPKKTSA